MKLATLILAYTISCAFSRAADDDGRINDAIARGSQFLLTADYKAAGHGIGPVCLAGLALLECDVKGDTNAIQSIANAVRRDAPAEASTYQVALAIIFLDRLGDPADIALIQILGARLLASQSLAGGWGYNASPAIDAAELGRIRASIASTPEATRTRLTPEAARVMAAVSQGQRNAAALGGDDNSNTQFATIAVWVARRNGIPVDGALRRLQARYLQSQSPGNGGWGYRMEEITSTPSMTCAGLLALAAAKAAEDIPQKPAKAPGENDNDPFYKPPAIGEEREIEANDTEAPPTVDPTIIPARDRAIERALVGVGALLQVPPSIAGTGTAAYGGVNDLYFYWSLERVAVAYGLDTIGGTDWYKWGCDGILPAQQANGSWLSAYDSAGVVGTSFALLFLKKANFTSDLSRKIRGKIKDPGGGELRGGRGVDPAGISQQGSATNRQPGEDPKAAKISKVRPTTAADTIAASLITATAAQWNSRLAIARDTKGSWHTQGLTKAIGQLEGKRLYQAREALAERLVRMTSATLRTLLTDRDAELRRAACLAIAMKDDWNLIPEVIDRITDPNEIVIRAAKASLKAFATEDHGPKSGATDIEKRDAADAWRAWHATAIRKRN